MDIKLIKREDIDNKLWDSCVHFANNSKIYAYTWYLDNIAEEWVGLVEGDYQSVMPLVFNEKLFGIKQIYQPYLCQQLGVISQRLCSPKRIENFLQAIPQEFKYIEMHLNDRNEKVTKIPDFEIEEKSNFLLNLNNSYEQLQEKYSSNLKRNIKKAEKASLFLSSNYKVETFVQEVKKAQEAKGVKHPEQLYHAAHRIIYNCLHRGLGSILTVQNQEKELLAGIFFMYNGPAMINLLNVTTPKGKEIGAMHFLLDMVIRQQAGSFKYIDFEGSDIDGIARFYQSFGAENIPYYKLKQNNLPWWIRWRKK